MYFCGFLLIGLFFSSKLFIRPIARVFTILLYVRANSLVKLNCLVRCDTAVKLFISPQPKPEPKLEQNSDIYLFNSFRISSIAKQVPAHFNSSSATLKFYLLLLPYVL